MKTLFILVSVMLVLFIAAPNKVEAQKKKTTKKANQKKVNQNANACSFCGVWKYVDNGHQFQGDKVYLKISQAEGNKFKLVTGFVDGAGEVEWTEPIIEKANGIYLKMVGEKLIGKFISPNFYATHGNDFTFRITCSLSSNNKMNYSIWSSGGSKTEKFVATRVSN
jgi:hypothetical protein